MGKHFGVASIVLLLFDCLHLWNSVKYIGWCVGDPENLIVCAFVCLKSRSQTNLIADGVMCLLWVSISCLLALFSLHTCMFVCLLCLSKFGCGSQTDFHLCVQEVFLFIVFMR